LQDAIDGYRLQNGVDARQLSLLQQRLNRRVENTIATRHAQYYTWQRLAIGAAAGVLFVVLLALLYFKHFTGKTERTTDVTLSEPENLVTIEPLLDGGDATPLGGWKAFEHYLNNQLKETGIGGDIIVNFTIGKDGLPAQIQAEDTPDQALVEETVRLLRSGVKWQGSKGAVEDHFPPKREEEFIPITCHQTTTLFWNRKILVQKNERFPSREIAHFFEKNYPFLKCIPQPKLNLKGIAI
jgi:hypothetical protein